MKTFVSLVLGFASVAAFAADSDPGYGPRTDSGAERVAAVRRSGRPGFDNYYRPLQYFYGDGYTVAYRLMPVDERVQRQLRTQGASEQMRVPATDVNTNSPVSPRFIVGRPKKKMSYYNTTKPGRSTPTSRAPVTAPSSSTTIKTTTTTATAAPTKPLPAVAEGEKK